MQHQTTQNYRRNLKLCSLGIKVLFISIMMLGTGAVLGIGQSNETDFATEVRVLSQQAITQLSIAIRLAVIAPQTPGINDMKISAGRILNTLVGEDNPLFNEDFGLPLNADRIGVIPRISRIRTLLSPHAESDARVRNWLNALENIEFFSNVAKEEMVSVLQQTNVRTAQISLRKTIAFLTATRGSDQDPLSEGGARALEQDIGRDTVE